MKCEEAKIEIESDFLAKANGNYTMALQTHLLSCRKCRGHGTKLGRIMQAVQLEKMVFPAERLRVNVAVDFKGLAEQHEEKRARRILFAFAGFAVLFLVSVSYWRAYHPNFSLSKSSTLAQKDSPKAQIQTQSRPEKTNLKKQNLYPQNHDRFASITDRLKEDLNAQLNAKLNLTDRDLKKQSASEPILTPSMRRNAELVAELRQLAGDPALPERVRRAHHDRALEALPALMSVAPNEDELSPNPDALAQNPELDLQALPPQLLPQDSQTTSAKTAADCLPTGNFDSFQALFNEVQDQVAIETVIEILAAHEQNGALDVNDPALQAKITDAVLATLAETAAREKNPDTLYTLESIYRLLESGKNTPGGTLTALGGALTGGSANGAMPYGHNASRTDVESLAQAMGVHLQTQTSTAALTDLALMRAQNQIDSTPPRQLAKSTDVLNACQEDSLAVLNLFLDTP